MKEEGFWDSIGSFLQGGTAFDLGAGLLVFVLFVLGMRRGFVAQAGRLVGLALGFVLARAFAGSLAPALAPRLPETDADLPYIVAFLAILLGAFVVVTFLAFLLRRAIEGLKLSFLDRFAGAILGAVTAGVLLVSLVLAVVLLVPAPNVSAFARTSWTMRAGIAALDRCRAVLPVPARTRLDALGE